MNLTQSSRSSNGSLSSSHSEFIVPLAKSLVPTSRSVAGAMICGVLGSAERTEGNDMSALGLSKATR